MVAVTSAAGLVGFLSEEDVALKTFALEQINEEIDTIWPEVSGSIGVMYGTTNSTEDDTDEIF